MIRSSLMRIEERFLKSFPPVFLACTHTLQLQKGKGCECAADVPKNVTVTFVTSKYGKIAALAQMFIPRGTYNGKYVDILLDTHLARYIPKQNRIFP